ncbi:hypothetical protein [Zooshikella sp. RANM57]|uniref:hypothetical protein n=1 Tax=Zooshikella sp. RANM57 TaxID=3425863 RepID=UPI003D6EDDBE
MKKLTIKKNSAMLVMLLVAICNQPVTYAAQETDNGYHSYRVAIGDNFKGIQNEIIIPWAYGATGDRSIGTNTNPEMFFGFYKDAGSGWKGYDAGVIYDKNEGWQIIFSGSKWDDTNVSLSPGKKYLMSSEIIKKSNKYYAETTIKKTNGSTIQSLRYLIPDQTWAKSMYQNGGQLSRHIALASNKASTDDYISDGASLKGAYFGKGTLIKANNRTLTWTEALSTDTSFYSNIDFVNDTRYGELSAYKTYHDYRDNYKPKSRLFSLKPETRLGYAAETVDIIYND